ncbi:MAG: glycosyltransferase family 2 protein [Sulfurifustaceae bacterium]
MSTVAATPFPSVTIAIPTYNRAGTYLRPCLEGALRQTYANIEIVVSDNGSTDETGAVVARFNDPRIRYFRQPRNIGPNENFNFCLRRGRGDYFLLLLDDEQIDPDFVEICMHAAEGRTDVALIRTGVRAINANGLVIGEMLNNARSRSLADLFLDWFASRTALYLCSTLFNRTALLDVGGFRSRHNLFQDVVALVRVAARGPRIEVPVVKATTRRHEGQYSHTAGVCAWCEDSLDLLDLMCVLAGEREEEIRRRGARFFARIGYSRASTVRSPGARFRAYGLVWRMFGYRHLPPPRLVLAGTALHRRLRNVKRRVLQRPAWVE